MGEVIMPVVHGVAPSRDILDAELLGDNFTENRGYTSSESDASGLSDISASDYVYEAGTTFIKAMGNRNIVYTAPPKGLTEEEAQECILNEIRQVTKHRASICLMERNAQRRNVTGIPLQLQEMKNSASDASIMGSQDATQGTTDVGSRNGDMGKDARKERANIVYIGDEFQGGAGAHIPENHPAVKNAKILEEMVASMMFDATDSVGGTVDDDCDIAAISDFDEKSSTQKSAVSDRRSRSTTATAEPEEEAEDEDDVENSDVKVRRIMFKLQKITGRRDSLEEIRPFLVAENTEEAIENAKMLRTADHFKKLYGQRPANATIVALGDDAPAEAAPPAPAAEAPHDEETSSSSESDEESRTEAEKAKRSITSAAATARSKRIIHRRNASSNDAVAVDDVEAVDDTVDKKIDKLAQITGRRGSISQISDLLTPQNAEEAQSNAQTLYAMEKIKKRLGDRPAMSVPPS